MKKAICSILICTCATLFGQQFDTVTLPPSYVSSKKDTLYLVNDSFGKLIANSWVGERYDPQRDGKKPVIMFVSQKYILKRHKMVTMTQRTRIVAEKKKELKK